MLINVGPSKEADLYSIYRDSRLFYTQGKAYRKSQLTFKLSRDDLVVGFVVFLITALSLVQ